MEIRLAQPVGFSQPGSRPNNEDILFPDPDVATPQQSWFMVCDGVGGAERGEVASQLAVSQFDAYFRAHPTPIVTAEYIQLALSTVQDRFDAYVQQNPAAAGMGTTLTLVYLHKAGATVAHLGDSRVYLVRQGKIQWRTDDHSYVNELVKGGVLTADQARHHPQRNIITRAIQGGDGGSDRSAAAIQFIGDLQPGDYFFLCSDGVLERVSDELLENVLGSGDSNAEKMRIIQACCTDQTRDNFTAYLIQIQAVSGATVPGFAAERPVYERPTSAPADEIIVVALPHTEPDDAQPAQVIALHDRLTAAPPEPAIIPPVFPLPVATTDLTGSVPSAGSRALWLSVVVFLLVAGFIGWKMFQKANQDETPVPVSSRLKPQSSGNDRSVSTPVAAALPNPVGALVSDTVAGDTTAVARTEPVSASSAPSAVAERPVIVRQVSEGVYVGKVAGKKGLLSADRETWLAEPVYDWIGPFQNGLAEVSFTGQTKYLSRTGKLYDEVGPLRCNRMCVRASDKYGYVDQNGELAIGIRYPKAGPFSDDCTAKVYIDEQMFRIDRNGLDVKTGHGPQVIASHRTTK